MSTYRAVQAVSPGKLELTEKPVLDPSAGHVRIRVEACGVCHSDSATVEGVLPIEWPRVPGHEAVGRIDAIGEGVEGWKLDQTGRRRLSRRQLRILRLLPRRRSRELHQPGLHRCAARWLLLRNNDRQGEWLDCRAGRPLLGRCGAPAMRWP